MEHGRGFFTVVEYIGPNPKPEYEGQDAHLIRTVINGAPTGPTTEIEERWFETHLAWRVHARNVFAWQPP
jgi:hypothetical protein